MHTLNRGEKGREMHMDRKAQGEWMNAQRGRGNTQKGRVLSNLMDRWPDGQTDCGIDGRTDRWTDMDVRTDTITDRKISI